MTNGEKIQEIFKGCDVCEPIIEDNIIHVSFVDKNDSAIGFDWDWWNMEYKEPTTKNDLGVDREDAVERLNALKQFIGYDEDSEIVKATQKSLDMAITALEHPKRNVVAIVPCGDAISRADVDAVIEQMRVKLKDGRMYILAEVVQDIIRELPTVTPHKKQAHWIGEEYDGYADGAPVYTSWVCSECGATFMCEDMDFLYCPRCGSVMEV